MSARLVLAIISTLLEEVALVAIALWALPRIGIRIPLPGLIALMVAWCVYSVIVYRMGSRALRKKVVINLPNMVGSRGKVVSPLAPEGMVRIRGELWVAKLASGEMQAGGDVVVVRQDRLKLVVRESGSDEDLEKVE